MTNYEAIKEMSIEEIAFVLYLMIEPFLDGDKDLELKAKISIMSMLREERTKKGERGERFDGKGLSEADKKD